MIPLTERLLNDAGGWQAMKYARSLHSAGRVTEASYDPPMLQGRVKDGSTEYRSGLRIGSKIDIENLCTCRESRSRGVICAHALAVGLAVLKPVVAPAPPKPIAAAEEPAGPAGELRATGNRIFSQSDGSKLELNFILPPNLPEAWDRGAVSLVVEAVDQKGRRPLNSVAPNTTYLCASEDWSALEGILGLTARELPGMLSLKRDQISKVLAALINHPRVTLGRATKVTVSSDPAPLKLQGKDLEDGSLQISISVPNGIRLLHAGTGGWAWRQPSLQPIAPNLPAAYRSILQQAVTIPADGVGAFCARELPILRQYFEVSGVSEVARPLAERAQPSAEESVFVLKIEGSLNHLGAQLEVQSPKRRVTLTSAGVRPASDAEAAALARLRQCGFEGPTPQGEWVMKGESVILRFFARDLPGLEKDWDVSVGARFEHVTKDLERVTPRFEVRGSGENWFEVGFELTTDSDQRVSANEVRRLLASGRRTLKLPNQKTAILVPELLDEFQTLLEDTNPNQIQPGAYRFDRRDAVGFASLLEQGNSRIENTEGADLNVRELLFHRPIGEPDLGSLAEVLRGYQKDGVAWLNRLMHNKLAGILADEMGLGKTLQTLAFFRLVRGSRLVVCPASLTLTWQREAERFAPELKPVLMSDLEPAQISGALKEERLLVTSYGLLRRDIDRLAGVRFGVVALDEAQHIKNPESQAAQAAYRLQAEAKVALTGTPIENGVRDIWSIMNFLMPGYLGKRDRFRERFEVPIRNAPGGAEQKRLVRRLSPFILRRTKREVAKELPDKIEQVTYVELTSRQKEIYSGLLTAARQALHSSEKGKAKGGGRMAIFTALLRLRQICCDPRLLQSEEERDAAEEVNSAKLELLEELLADAIEDGHRILVFSQFSSMLGLIRKRLESLEIPMCYLDGSTRNRQEVVDRFQRQEAPVFLISLKAGGVGLTLTAADTVVHYDPWWNPAVEAQATDRAHRIGQDRTVNVYKLITRGTVEERILNLQAVKRELTAGLVDSENPLMTGLSESDIAALLE